MVAVKARKRILFVALVLIALTLFATKALRAVPRGPLECTYCPLGSPAADRTTEKFLRRKLAPIERLPLVPYLSGVEYTVCNRTQCINYVVNLDNKFRSTGPKFDKDPPDPPQPPVHVIEPPPQQPPPRFAPPVVTTPDRQAPPGMFLPPPTGGGGGCVSVNKRTPICSHY